MAPSRGVVAKALDRGNLVQTNSPAPLEVASKAELGRRHWERAVALSRLPPQPGYDFTLDYDSQVGAAYDALIALSEALIRARGYRRKGSASHQLLLAVAEELLARLHPKEAIQLGQNAHHLRQERNALKYDRFGVTNQQERDQVFRVLPPILKALEADVFAAIGQPLPGHVW